MMPGGGAQYAGMGRELYEQEPVYRAVIDDCADALRRRGAASTCSTSLFPDGDLPSEAARRLEAPSVALPALFATEVRDGPAAGVVGHHPGGDDRPQRRRVRRRLPVRVVSAWRTGCALVALRGRLFETLPKGAMLSVPLSEDEAARRACPTG